MENKIDIKEDYIYHLDSKLLAILLRDKSSRKISYGQRITTLIAGLNIVAIWKLLLKALRVEMVA